jgi:guanylate kinase
MSSSTPRNAHESTSASTEGTSGNLFVISSPSGGGKGTLIRHVLERVENVSYSISYTTRQPRAGETNGKHYFFVESPVFREMIQAGEFLEWATVHGNLYGTSRRQVENELSRGNDVILEIDVQGAANIRRVAPEAVSIFILPPSFEILQQRLNFRGSENSDGVALRLRNAIKEVRHYGEFEYVVINEDALKASGQLAEILRAERVKRPRQEAAALRVIATFPYSL